MTQSLTNQSARIKYVDLAKPISGLEPGSSDSEPSALTTGLPGGVRPLIALHYGRKNETRIIDILSRSSEHLWQQDSVNKRGM